MALQNPQTIYNDLIDTINQYMVSGQSPSDFESRRLRRDVEKLKGVAPVQGWQVSAMISSLQWDQDAVLIAAKNAVANSPRDCDVLVVASQCLWNVGLYSDAEEYSRSALSIAPNNSVVLQTVVEQLVCKARFTEASELHKKAMSMGVVLETNIPEYQKHQARLSQAGVTEERMRLEAELAIKLMASKCIRPRSLSFTPWTDPDSGSVQVSIAYVFQGSVLQEIELEHALAELLSEDPHWDPSRLSTEFEAAISDQ